MQRVNPVWVSNFGPKEWFGEEAKELIASLLPPPKKGGGKAE